VNFQKLLDSPEETVTKRYGRGVIGIVFVVAILYLGAMKVYILFFITYTIMEIVFSFSYYLVVQKIDLTIMTGAAMYAVGMLKGYQAYQYFRYKEKRKAMLHGFLQHR
jgi:hypothetical protein